MTRRKPTTRTDTATDTYLLRDSCGQIGVVIDGDLNPVVVVMHGGVLVGEDAPFCVDRGINDEGFDLEVAVKAVYGPGTVTAGPALVSGVFRLAVGYILRALQESERSPLSFLQYCFVRLLII